MEVDILFNREVSLPLGRQTRGQLTWNRGEKGVQLRGDVKGGLVTFCYVE